jgi:hypothetical protein
MRVLLQLGSIDFVRLEFITLPEQNKTDNGILLPKDSFASVYHWHLYTTLL